MSRTTGAGFTLLELLITLAVITVLGMIAITSYSDFLVRGYRAEAKVLMSEIAQKEERYFSAYHQYLHGADAVQQFRGVNADDIRSENGMYQLEVKQNGSVGYLLEVTPVAGKPAAARDEKCRVFTLDHTGKESAKNDAGNDTTAVCWGR